MDFSDPYVQLWGLWLLMFAAIEGPALANDRKADTLSELVRRWIGTSNNAPKPTGYKLRRGALLAFFGWLIWHFFR